METCKRHKLCLSTLWRVSFQFFRALVLLQTKLPRKRQAWVGNGKINEYSEVIFILGAGGGGGVFFSRGMLTLISSWQSFYGSVFVFFCFISENWGLRTLELLEVKVFFLLWPPGDVDGVRLTSKDANSFFSPVKRFFTSLRHECYEEGCDFEEVEEVMGSSQKAVCLP